MDSRLLSFLSMVETALALNESPAVSKPPVRTVSFHKGLARMAFSDGSGAVMLQAFRLADGQICVKALMSWAGSEATRTHAIYPQGNFHWQGAAERVAELWLEGPPAVAVPEPKSSGEAGGPGVDGLAAVG